MSIKRFTALILSAFMLLPVFSSCVKTEDEISGIQNINATENTENDKTSETIEESVEQLPPVEEPITNIPSDAETENIFASETIEQFYENAAFVGDSVMFGLEIYSRRKKTLQSAATFLTLSSFAARHALSDVNEGSYHPSYQGQKMKVEDALVLDGANKVFLFLGLNDVRVTPKDYFENYIKFIDRIKEKNPEIKIFIISTTYPIKAPHCMDTPTATSYRNQLKDLDEKLLGYCNDGNAYYIDVVTPLLNGEDFLSDKYTSDKYVHLTNSAYEIWTQILDEYATSLITTGKPPVKEALPEENISPEQAQPDIQQETENSASENETTEVIYENSI